MKAPDKLYIFEDGDKEWYSPEGWDTPPPGKIEYIRKDAIMEILENAKNLGDAACKIDEL